MKGTARIELRDEAVVALCLAASNVTVLPARPWPLDAALQRLAVLLPPESPYAEAAALHGAAAQRGTGGTERLLRLLAEAGRVSQLGTGAGAAWAFDSTWAAEWSELLGGLGPREGSAFRVAGQVLASCVSTWRSALSRASV